MSRSAGLASPPAEAGVAPARAKPPAMTEHVASRTLVKSPPELWAECSDAASLARHLDQFGEIRITRLDPETAVAWEGERARGTVRIEPAGWGTKVILTAVEVAGEVAAEAAEGSPRSRQVRRSRGAGGRRSPRTWMVRRSPRTRMVAGRRGGARAGRSAREPASLPSRLTRPSRLTDPSRSSPPEPATDPPPRRRRFARLFGLPPRSGARPAYRPRSRPGRTAGALEPQPAAEPAPEPVVPEPSRRSLGGTARKPPPAAGAARTTEPATEDHRAARHEATATSPPPKPPATEAALTAALDSLGQAHHRPYSRA